MVDNSQQWSMLVNDDYCEQMANPDECPMIMMNIGSPSANQTWLDMTTPKTWRFQVAQQSINRGLKERHGMTYRK